MTILVEWITHTLYEHPGLAPVKSTETRLVSWDGYTIQQAIAERFSSSTWKKLGPHTFQQTSVTEPQHKADGTLTTTTTAVLHEPTIQPWWEETQ